LYKYFMDRLLDNLHIILCFSPVNAKFPIRAQKFPAIFGVNINWFLPWPESALVAVSTSFLTKFKLDTSKEEKARLYSLLGSYHVNLGSMCDTYYSRMRKHVYVTPKSFLSLIDSYKTLYKSKYDEVNLQEKSVNTGLSKLREASEVVDVLKVRLQEQQVVLKSKEAETTALLRKVQGEKVKADRKKEEVGSQAAKCGAEADKIGAEKADAQNDLETAMPFLREAEAACNSIQKKDIAEMKTNKNPADIIKLSFDGLLLLQSKQILPVARQEGFINKLTAPFIKDSFEEYARRDLADINFLKSLLDFATNEKDNMNDETCELLEPYLRFDAMPSRNWSPWPFPVLDPENANKASGAAAGLCKFVGAMVQYYGAAKFVKPKIDSLTVAEAKLGEAMAELKVAQSELQKVLDEVALLDEELKEAQDTMNALKQHAHNMQSQMDTANRLLVGLSGENQRWTEDSRNFAVKRKRLVGDVAVVSAFVSYVGPFNAMFRNMLHDQFTATCHEKRVPAHQQTAPVEFLIDQGTVGNWALEGLPNDDLSIQNAIVVTRSSRYPLMIDPQGQALRWIKAKETRRIAVKPEMCVTTL